MNKKRRGFTLVELLVVIAILSILATVSVIGYLAFTKKADFSVDQSNVTIFNSVLDGEKALDGPNKSFSEARADLFANGYDIAYIKPRSEGHFYAWDSKTDHFVLVDGLNSKVMWPQDYENPSNSTLVSPVANQEELTAIGNTSLVGEYFLMDSFELTSMPSIGTLDLNGMYVEVNPNTFSTFDNIKNGYIVPTEAWSNKPTSSDETLKIMGNPTINLNDSSNKITFRVENGVAKLTDTVYKYETVTGNGQIVPDLSSLDTITSLEISNCIFDGFTLMLNDSIKADKALKSITISDCVFQNSTHYGMGVDIFLSNYTITDITISGNKFINCLRGINLSPAQTITIEDNYFELQNDIDNNRAGIAIMFQNGSTKSGGSGWVDDAKVSIENNTFQYGLTAVYLHFKMGGWFNGTVNPTTTLTNEYEGSYGASLSTYPNNDGQYFGAKNFSFANNYYSSEYVVCEDRLDFANQTTGAKDWQYTNFKTREEAKPYLDAYLAELAKINAKGR